MANDSHITVCDFIERNRNTGIKWQVVDSHDENVSGIYTDVYDIPERIRHAELTGTVILKYWT